jgi:hypothetical protein
VNAPQASKSGPGPYLILCAVVLMIAAGLIVYSQTYSFANDEGFHLVAAQLIGAGKRPYIDFFFPQTPLNAYWNAGWMTMFGESWRVTHVVASLTVAGAILLAADHVYRRFPDPGWRLAAALTAALCFGLNELVVMFGTLAQAYGLCLLLIVGAFRCTVAVAGRAGVTAAAGAGLLATAAATASLLTAPVAPVLLMWLMWCGPAPARLPRFFAFGAGAVVALLPLLWLFAEGPRQVVFDILTYHGLYRQVGWPGAAEHNVEVYSAWVDSGHALFLGGLAVAALLRALPAERFRGWRREMVLCGALALAQIAFVCTAVPTHQRYVLFAVPFLAMLAPAGLYVLTAAPRRPLVPMLAVGAFLGLATAKALFDERGDYLWSDAESIAAKVQEVTPPDRQIYAEESVYFLTRRAPPSGLEHSDALKLSLPAEMNRLLHLMPKQELARHIAEGQFATVELCEDEDKEILDVDKLFAESSEFDDCTVHWNFVSGATAQTAAPAK